MKLEEAKENLRTIIREQNEPDDLKSIKYMFAVKSIETLLKELENSISKDKVREIRDKFKLEYEKNIEKNPTYAFVLKCKLEVLEELLEDK